jgi:hypothetical protein
LRNWGHSPQKIADAKNAVAELKAYLKAQDQEIQNEKEKEDAKSRAREIRQKIQRSHTDKFKLQQRLDDLHAAIGTQQGGYDFQDWFYDLLDFCEIENRRPYMNTGRQIDGSLTLDGTTYLVELKLTASQADATDIDSLRSKVDDKADNTTGVMVSISGYTSTAVIQASGRKTTLLLFDAQHLYLFLAGALSFMRLRHWNEPVQALAANSTDHPFTDRITLRAPRRRLQHPDSQSPDRLVEVACEDAIAIVKQEFVLLLISHHLPQLLQRPNRGRMGGDIEMHKAAAVVLDDYEYIQEAKLRGDGNEEVTANDSPRVQA